jgi:hypothetical protein
MVSFHALCIYGGGYCSFQCISYYQEGARTVTSVVEEVPPNLRLCVVVILTIVYGMKETSVSCISLFNF